MIARIASKMAVARVAGICAALLACPSAASARDLNSIAQPAFGVEGYYQTKDRCFYADGVDAIIAKVDHYMELQHGSRWQAMRERVAPQIDMSVNQRRIIDGSAAASADQMLCDAVAVHIAFVLTLGALMVGPDAPGIEDLNRLSGGTGRVSAMPADAQSTGAATANDSEIGTKQGQIMIKGFCTFSAIVAKGQSRTRTIADDQGCVLTTDEQGRPGVTDFLMFDGEPGQYDMSYAFRLTSHYFGEGRQKRRERYLAWNAMPGSEAVDQNLGLVGGDEFKGPEGACWYTKTVELCMRLASGRDVRMLAPGLKPLE